MVPQRRQALQLHILHQQTTSFYTHHTHRSLFRNCYDKFARNLIVQFRMGKPRRLLIQATLATDSGGGL